MKKKQIHKQIKIHLLDTNTGERVVTDGHGGKDWSESEWFWSEGNFGCDCNRLLMFDRENEGEYELACNSGDNKVIIEKVICLNGTEILAKEYWNE